MHQFIHYLLYYTTALFCISTLILGIINVLTIFFLGFFGQIYFKKVHNIELKFDSMTYFSPVGFQEIVRRIVKYVILYYKIEYSRNKNKLESRIKKLDFYDNPLKDYKYDIKKEKKWFIYICFTFKITLICFPLFLILSLIFLSIHY